MIYIAGPYSHKRAHIQAFRAKVTTQYAAHLLSQRILAYSPLTHGHEIAQMANFNKWHIPTDAGFWWAHNRHMLKHCTQMHIIALDGWRTSQGVLQEIEAAMEFALPISMVECNSLLDAHRHFTEINIEGHPYECYS